MALQRATVTLAAGVHQGPLVLDHEQILVGKPGAVVRGGGLLTIGSSVCLSDRLASTMFLR